jgi:Putative Ig domain
MREAPTLASLKFFPRKALPLIGMLLIQSGCGLLIRDPGLSSPSNTAVSLNVNTVAPGELSYGSNNTFTFPQNMALNPSLTPAHSGGAVALYSGSLPPGLTLNSTTGVISGIPSLVAPQTSYVVTASNSGGQTDVTLSITVGPQPPNVFTYLPNLVTYTENTSLGNAATPNNSTVGGLAFTVNPPLPSGLSINASTGVLSGTPTVVSSQTTYTVTAQNASGEQMANLIITVNDPFEFNDAITGKTALAYDFAPGLTSNCWQWDGVTGTLGWKNGGGSVSPLGNCVANYAVLNGVESMLFYPGNTDPRSVIPTGVVGYQPGAYAGTLPAYFSYENYYGLVSPDSLATNVAPNQIRMVKGLSYFNLIPRTAEGMPNSFNLQSVLDKINAQGLSNDEVGTSMGQLFDNPYAGNKFAMASFAEPAAYAACQGNLTCLTSLTAKYVPNLGNANGNGLQHVVSLKIIDEELVDDNSTAHFCLPGHYIGLSSAGGHCDGTYGSHKIGSAAARMMISFNLSWIVNNQVVKNYYLEIVPWIEGFNLIGAFQNIPGGGNHDLVLGYVPSGNGTPEQIYLNAAALGSSRVTANGPICPGNQFSGNPQLVPGGAWANYRFDISALFQCIPWSQMPTDLSEISVVDVYYGPNINGKGRVYWQLQNTETFKDQN